VRAYNQYPINHATKKTAAPPVIPNVSGFCSDSGSGRLPDKVPELPRKPPVKANPNAIIEMIRNFLSSTGLSLRTRYIKNNRVSPPKTHPAIIIHCVGGTFPAVLENFPIALVAFSDRFVATSTLFVILANFYRLPFMSIYQLGNMRATLKRQKYEKLFNFASACVSANGKVKRRRRDGGNGAAAKRPSRNRRRKAADPSALNAARDERAFLRNGTGAVVRGFGRTASGEVEKESVLVAANRKCLSDKSYWQLHPASKFPRVETVRTS